MARMGATPEEFGLAVREDPGLLVVTNLGKRRDTRLLDLSFAGKCKETIVLRTDSSEHNIGVLDILIKQQMENEMKKIKTFIEECSKLQTSGYKGHFTGVNSKGLRISKTCNQMINLRNGI